jgi:hypothetical protein
MGVLTTKNNFKSRYSNNDPEFIALHLQLCMYHKTAHETASDSDSGCTFFCYHRQSNRNRTNPSCVNSPKVAEASAAIVAVTCSFTGGFVVHIINVNEP